MRQAFARYVNDLAQYERMPLRHLARHQEHLLARLIAHARAKVPFYRERLDALITESGAIDLSRWHAVPILNRAEVIAHNRAIRVAELPRQYGAINSFRTSGSTDEPLELACNELVFISTNALFTRMAHRFGLDLSRPLAALRRFTDGAPPPAPEGRVTNGWSVGNPDTLFYELELVTPVEQQLLWLGRNRAPYLVTQPSAALAIAHAVTPERGRALGIEIIFLVGETIPDGTREFIAERLGARVAGVYSCQEIGTIACECEAAPVYHVAVENALVEILDEQGRDVSPGERGRVVVTGFCNYAMPFIRYDLGDIALAGATVCPCGRAHPVIAQIEGRTRNVFVFRDGTRVWPRPSMIRPMHTFVPFKRFQLVQLDHERLEFRYITDGSGRDVDIAGLNTYARQALHPSVVIYPLEMKFLSPGPNGKFDQFISQIPMAQSHWPSTSI